MTLTERLKEYEGSISYQKSKGYYCNGLFMMYKDSEGYDTIGYGHLVSYSEYGMFQKGISEFNADKMLQVDINIAIQGFSNLNISVPDDWREFLIIMIFQLGLTKTKGFKKMIAALRECQWSVAVAECKDSKWYKQTPNRVNDMIAHLTHK